jgi:hypothetical protein
MNLKAKKNFSNNVTGNVESGQTLYDVPQHVAIHLIDAGLCEAVGMGQAKRPLDSGQAAQSSSSQAGQASQNKIVNTSDSDTSEGSVKPSQSTPLTNESLGQTASMDSTALGGNGTTKKRRKGAKK